MSNLLDIIIIRKYYGRKFGATVTSPTSVTILCQIIITDIIKLHYLSKIV